MNSATKPPSTGTAAMKRWFTGSPHGSRSCRQVMITVTAWRIIAAP
jgi:hypothetical protein